MGECVTKLATFMLEHNFDAGILALLMKLVENRNDDEGTGGAKVASISFTFPHSTFQIIYLPEQLICMYLSFNQYNPLYMSK